MNRPSTEITLTYREIETLLEAMHRIGWDALPSSHEEYKSAMSAITKLEQAQRVFLATQPRGDRL